MSSEKGRIIVISGPSGTGKGSIIARLLELRPQMKFSVSATTRVRRENEEDGVAYYFMTHDRFREMISRDEFLEYAEYVGEFYGTPKQPIYDCVKNGTDIVLDIEVKGARQIMSKEPEAITIFVTPPNMDELERRLRVRGTDSEEKMKARLERARAELEEKVYYDNIVVNDNVNHAAEEILSIIIGKE